MNVDDCGASVPMDREPTTDDIRNVLIEDQVNRWKLRYDLTLREVELLSRTARGETPKQLEVSLRVGASTVAKHRENLLRKTRDDSLASAAHRLILEVIDALAAKREIDRSSR